jgi:hypothetical protein
MMTDSELAENNIFDLYRGKSGGGEGDKAPPNFDYELIGICAFGDVSGIIVSDKRGAMAGIMNAAQQRGGPPGAPGALGMPQQSSDSKPSSKRFYKIGETLNNGYTLEKTTNDSAILSRGNEQIVLKLEYDDSGSKMRLASAATEQAKRIYDNKPKTPAASPPAAQSQSAAAQAAAAQAAAKAAAAPPMPAAGVAQPAAFQGGGMRGQTGGMGGMGGGMPGMGGGMGGMGGMGMGMGGRGGMGGRSGRAAAAQSGAGAQPSAPGQAPAAGTGR